MVAEFHFFTTSIPEPHYCRSFNLIPTGGGVLRRRSPSGSKDEIDF